MVLYFGISPVHWRSLKLPCVVKSVTAAEYVAASMTSDEICVIRVLLQELGYNLSVTSLNVDNSACKTILESGKVDGKTKYLAVHWHCVRERIEQGVIAVEWVPTEENVADVFTKPVVLQTFCKFREDLC
jgi:hypothetical protein